MTRNRSCSGCAGCKTKRHIPCPDVVVCGLWCPGGCLDVDRERKRDKDRAVMGMKAGCREIQGIRRR
jgi:hypothetical protein